MHQREKVLDRHRAGRRLRAVVLLLDPQEHGRIVPGGGEPAAALFVPEKRVLAGLQLDRPVEPRRVARSLEQLQQPPDEVRVVLRVAVDGDGAVAGASPQNPPIRVPQPLAGERRRAGRCLEAPISRLAVEHVSGPRQGCDHQAVPGRQHLVVQVRAGPPGARGEERPARRAESCHDIVRAAVGQLRNLPDVLLQVGDVPAAELPHRVLRRVASRLDPETPLRHLRVGAEQRVDFLVGPEIEGALGLRRIRPHRLRRETVGVLGRVEGALGAGHVAPHVLDGVLGHVQQRAGAGRLSRLQKGQDELRLVVQHLLEVRDPPGRVDRVAMEAAPDVVAHAAARHRLQRGHRDAPGILVTSAGRLPEEEEKLGRPRKLGRPAEAAVPRVEGGSELLHAGGKRIDPGDSARTRAAGRRRRLHVTQATDHRIGRLLQLTAVGRPARRHLPQHVGKPGPPPSRLRGKVRAAEERLQVGGEPDAHRPAAGAGRRLHERHVDPVDVGTLLAVDLDRHEVLVELRGDAGMLERLVLHDVAPVAGRVADRQEDRLVLAAGALERLVAPGIPVHGVLGVLLQVRTGLAGETIGHGWNDGTAAKACCGGAVHSIQSAPCIPAGARLGYM